MHPLDTTAETAPPERAGRQLVAGVAVAAALASVGLWGADSGLVDAPAARHFGTVLISLTVQAFPFLVGGIVIAAAVAAFVPPGAIRKLLPRNEHAAVGVASCAGFGLPGCECASVPLSARIASAGTPPAAALAFMLAAPAINPIVLVATAVAFAGQPEMVWARLSASLTVAVATGVIWLKLGRDDLLAARLERLRVASETGTRRHRFVSAASHDILHAGGWLVVGATVAATIQTLVPSAIVQTVADNWWLSIAVMAILAILLSICSEADAFVAASLTRFSPTSQLVFMVVGPVVDLKLIAMQIGVYGREFARIFVPLTLTIALSSALAVGWLVL